SAARNGSTTRPSISRNLTEGLAAPAPASTGAIDHATARNRAAPTSRRMPSILRELRGTAAVLRAAQILLHALENPVGQGVIFLDNRRAVGPLGGLGGHVETAIGGVCRGQHIERGSARTARELRRAFGQAHGLTGTPQFLVGREHEGEV